MDLTPAEQMALDAVQSCLCTLWTAAEPHPQVFGGLELDLVAGLAQQQKVEALLWRLSENSPYWASLFEALLPRWQKAFFLNSARNALLQKTLRAILSSLAENNISVITLKGWAQISRLYADAGVRPTADIDLLIRDTDLAETVELLLGQGFIFADSRADLTGLSYQSEVALVHEGLPSKPKVELHWHLFDAPHWQQHVDLDWFWETAVQNDWAGLTLMLFSNEATFIYESAHLQLHHTGNELKWLTDLGLLVQKTDLDWDLILKKSLQMQLALPLRLTSQTLSTQWAVPIPERILSQLQLYIPSKFEADQFDAMRDHSRNPGQRFLADIQSIGNIAGGLRFGRENLFPSRSYMRKRYAIDNTRWVWPYYLYRWWLGLSQLLKQTKK